MKNFIYFIFCIIIVSITNDIFASRPGNYYRITEDPNSNYFEPRICGRETVEKWKKKCFKGGDIKYVFPTWREAYLAECDANIDPPDYSRSTSITIGKLADELYWSNNNSMKKSVKIYGKLSGGAIRSHFYQNELEDMDKIIESEVCSDSKGASYCSRYKRWREQYNMPCICLRERTLGWSFGNIMGEVEGCFKVPLAPGPSTGVDFFKKLAAFRVVPYKDFSFSHPVLKVGIGQIEGKECGNGSKIGKDEICSDGSAGKLYGVQWKDIDFNSQSTISDAINYEGDDYYYKTRSDKNQACIDYYGFDASHKNKIRSSCFYGTEKFPFPKEIKKIANKIEFVVAEDASGVKEKSNIYIMPSSSYTSGRVINNLDTKYQMLFLTNPKFNDDYSRKYKKYCVRSGSIAEYDYSHVCSANEGTIVAFDSADSSSKNYCIAGGNFNNYIYKPNSVSQVEEIVRLHDDDYLIIPKTVYHNATTSSMEYIDDYQRSSYEIGDLSQNSLDTLLYDKNNLYKMNDKLYAYDRKNYYALLDKNKVEAINLQIKIMPKWGDGYGYNYIEVNTMTDYHKLGLNDIIGNNVAVKTQYLDINNQPYAITEKDSSPFDAKDSKILKINPEVRKADEFENGLCVTEFPKKEYNYQDALTQSVVAGYNANTLSESSDGNANNNFSSNGVVIDSNNTSSHFGKQCRFLRFKVWAGGSAGYVANGSYEENQFGGAKAFSGASGSYFEGVINAEKLPNNRSMIHILIGQGGTYDPDKFVIKNSIIPMPSGAIEVADGAEKFIKESYDRGGGDSVILLCDDSKGSNCDIINRVYGGRDQGTSGTNATIEYDKDYGFYVIESKKSLNGEINMGILKSPLQNGLKGGNISQYIDIKEAGCEIGNYKTRNDSPGAGGCANQNDKLYQNGGDGRVEVICEDWDR
ncbi:MAG: hypothetical protein OEY79_00785 [Anaplasmataceae bacterium]|nr:hypothetical protein [Anaplasmataceae bacterium]